MILRGDDSIGHLRHTTSTTTKNKLRLIKKIKLNDINFGPNDRVDGINDEN